jgi:hypothetical protein
VGETLGAAAAGADVGPVEGKELLYSDYMGVSLPVMVAMSSLEVAAHIGQGTAEQRWRLVGGVETPYMAVASGLLSELA